MDIHLHSHLLRLNLGSYIAVLQENGYTSWHQVIRVDEEDLERLGFKLGHRRRLQREIASMEGYPLSAALPSCGMDTTQDSSKTKPQRDITAINRAWPVR